MLGFGRPQFRAEVEASAFDDLQARHADPQLRGPRAAFDDVGCVGYAVMTEVAADAEHFAVDLL